MTCVNSFGVNNNHITYIFNNANYKIAAKCTSNMIIDDFNSKTRANTTSKININFLYISLTILSIDISYNFL